MAGGLVNPAPGRTPTSPQIAYEVRGASGTPVLLVMGLGMRGAVWSAQTPVLARHHRVATFDNRGVGSSEGGPRFATMGDFAADTIAVADALGWDRFHLVGVSMGGMVAQETALKHASRLRSLSLIATHGGGRSRIPPAKGLARFVSLRTGGPDVRLERLKRLLYPEEYLKRVDPVKMNQHMADRVAAPPGAAAVRRQVSAVMRHNTLSRLPALGVPTLVVQPGLDQLVDPAASEHLAAAIPGSTLVRFPSAGHGVILQEAEALNARLLEHFASHDP
jgi:3-oxoadipate enol-lactonase